ncbi:MAG TPA: sodium:proton antiporter [Phycisphaeraceae bacterium]|nr:sodium:proton antiporter [Phycisphaeraceae bacterium]
MDLLASLGEHSFVSDTVRLTITLLVIAASVGVATRIVRIPYTVALVLTGFVIALFRLAPEQAILSRDLVLILFLPPLLFQAGLHLDLRHLRGVWLPVALLALPGVLLSMIVVGGAVYYFLPKEITSVYSAATVALLFGAMLAATDPISVLAAFKRAGVPAKLKTIVEGESLFNDGTGVVLFVLLLSMVMMQAPKHDSAAEGEGADRGSAVTQMESVPADQQHDSVAIFPETGDSSGGNVIVTATNEFIKVVGLGTLLGLVIGIGGVALLAHIDDHTLENAITIIMVWGGFLLAEELHASGVFTVVIVGLLIGNYGRFLSMSEETRLTVEGFWDAIDFVINSLVFLLIGTELQEIGTGSLFNLTAVVLPTLAVFVALLVSRALAVYPLSFLHKRSWPEGWNHVIFWAGLKGSIPLALVLGMEHGPVRSFFLPIIFLVVLLSLVGQGVTMPLLINMLGVSETSVGRKRKSKKEQFVPRWDPRKNKKADREEDSVSQKESAEITAEDEDETTEAEPRAENIQETELTKETEETDETQGEAEYPVAEENDEECRDGDADTEMTDEDERNINGEDEDRYRRWRRQKDDEE